MHLDVPVIGILRGVEADFFSEIMSASFAEGLQAIEVTMNTNQAEKIVGKNRHSVPSGKFLGMGTIRNLEEARRAIEVGAMYIVTPNLDLSVIEYAQLKSIPIIAGALTPTEVYKAWVAGADMVKVFPCRPMGGVNYIRDLRGPLEHIPLVAVGGVTARNVRDYLVAGATAVGVSSSLFGKDAIKNKNIEILARNVSKFIACCGSGENTF